MYIIFVIIFLFTFHYCFFLYGVLRGIKKLRREKLVTDIRRGVAEEFISIIIPFRNESENILLSLQSLEKQVYTKDKFEVIYVNDCSEDDSLIKIMNAEKSSNIRVISVPEGYYSGAHKKRAIKYAIEHSVGSIIVSTDCDCIHNENWLSSMIELYDENTAFISGPVKFTNDGSLFSSFQALEFSGLILVGAGLIGIGEPIICNAANLSYRKKVYSEVGGFEDNMNLSSGDDELLMQKISQDTDYKIRFSMNKDSVVQTSPNKTIGQFYNQRKRWASKGLFYMDKLLILKLILIFLFYLSLFIQLVFGVIFSPLFLISLFVVFLPKFLFEYLVLSKGSGFLTEKKMLRYVLPFELLQIPYILVASVSGVFGNYSWKNRRLRR